MNKNALTTAEAEAIWQILIEECGATRDHGFVHHQTSGYETEWRFIGTLGFGGKFRRNRANRPDGEWGEIWYVDYYPEDRTTERDAAVKRANARLWDLLCTSEAASAAEA